MSNNIVAKCQWLEKKCKEYQESNQKLRKRLQRLGKLSSDRDIPSQMYNHEIEYANYLIMNALQGNSDAYQLFIKIPSPSSYNELYYKNFPDLKKHFVSFVRTIKNYLDFLQKCTYTGPIFINVINKTNVSLQDKRVHVMVKLNHYRSLLQSSSWSVSLDELSKNIREEILKWLIQWLGILCDIDACLQPKELDRVSVEMDDADFEGI